MRVTATFRKITVYSGALYIILVKTFAGAVGRSETDKGRESWVEFYSFRTLQADNKNMNISSPRGIY
jgi:hypothetical protein